MLMRTYSFPVLAHAIFSLLLNLALTFLLQNMWSYSQRRLMCGQFNVADLCLHINLTF